MDYRSDRLQQLPIIFEVYKWLLQRTTPQVAQNSLKTMEESLHFLSMDDAMYDEVQAMIFSLPQWRGSLEDATVAITALRYRCPIWTLNLCFKNNIRSSTYQDNYQKFYQKQPILILSNLKYKYVELFSSNVKHLLVLSNLADNYIHKNTETNLFN